MSSTDGDLLHTVTADNISDGRRRLGKLMVWGFALCAAQVIVTPLLKLVSRWMERPA